MARKWTRRGISRWNAIGIILLLAVLLSLVLPAIESSREAARQNACSNNLRQILTGLASYHDVHKMFPMGAMHAGPNPGGEPPVTAALGPSWWFGVLPLMDRPGGPNVRVTLGPKSVGNVLTNAGGPMYDRIVESQRPGQDVQCQFCADDVSRYLNAHPYTANDGQHVGRLTIFMMAPTCMRCPSCPVAMSETSTGPITMPSYVGIAGGCDIDPKSKDYRVNGIPSEFVPLGAKPIDYNKYKGAGAAEGGIDTLGGLPAVWGGDCWNITTVRYPANLKRVLGTEALPGCSENHGINNPLQSPHPGGLLVGMADGSVQFIQQTTDLGLLLRLSIRDDGVSLRNGEN